MTFGRSDGRSSDTAKEAGADVDDEISRFGGPVPPMFLAPREL